MKLRLIFPKPETYAFMQLYTLITDISSAITLSER